MKTILFYLGVIFCFLFSNNVCAQDEFYKNPTTTEAPSAKSDSIDISSYSTAEDYYSSKDVKENITTEQAPIIDDSREEKRRKSERGEFISNVVADVFINAVLIVLTFWQ